MPFVRNEIGKDRCEDIFDQPLAEERAEDNIEVDDAVRNCLIRTGKVAWCCLQADYFAQASREIESCREDHLNLILLERNLAVL